MRCSAEKREWSFGLPTTFLCRTFRRLAEEKGVVCTPMSVFYASEIFARAPCTLVRFTVCKSREHIQRACAALAGRRGRRERVAVHRGGSERETL